MNQTAQNFLETLARGGQPEGGWLYAKALQQAQLDYSDGSLGRLDQLLTAIRERVKPSRETMQESVEGRNFCSLIAFYVVEMLHRLTHASIDWHDKASAQRELPPGAQLPDAPFARLVALAPDQGAALMPLGWVEAQVLGQGAPSSARDCLASMRGNIEHSGPAVWWTGMHALGRMASWQMMMASDGGGLNPLQLSSTKPTTWVSHGMGLPGEDIDAALQRAGRILDTNPDGAAWQVLSYDGMADLKSGRIDALMVILYTYGPSPLKLKLAFPYRRGPDGRLSVIFDPTLRETNVSQDTVAKLGGAMMRGIGGVKWVFGTTWDQLRVSGP
jgi:hypothetical protein